MNDNLSKIYSEHHLNSRSADFSILEKERGGLLKDHIGTNKEVLDLGCRNGVLTKYFVQNNDVLGVDIDKESLGVANENLKINTLLMDLNGDWKELGDKRFDVVVLGEVLEHLYFPGVVLEKIRKHLNDNGLLLGSIPNAFSLKNRLRYFLARKKETPLGDPTHINHFSFYELKDLLEKYFNEVEIIGLSRYKKLAIISPNFFAFDLFFIARK